MAIPRILHYCWFGGNDFPQREEKCFESWNKHLSSFVLKKWDESNFDVHVNRYVEEAYNAKKFMYVSDYARLLALYTQGGLYLDTDCLVKRDFSPLLEQNDAFTGFGGDNAEIAAHALAFKKGHPFIKKCLDTYENDSFVREDGSYNLLTINERMTRLLEAEGFKRNGAEQTIADVRIYPMTYFCPLSMLPDSVPDCKSKNTFCIHVWSSKELKRERNIFVKFAHKTGLNRLKRKIFSLFKRK